jgi:hypothetical protein
MSDEEYAARKYRRATTSGAQEIKMTQQQTQQSQHERQQILQYFFTKLWPKYFPDLEPLFSDEACLVDRIEARPSKLALMLSLKGMQGEWTHNRLIAKVAELDAGGLLIHKPKVVERIVEVERPTPLSLAEQAKRDNEAQKRANANRDDSPIKGYSRPEAKKPVATTEQLEEQARHDLNENAVMGEVRNSIAQHTHSGSHSGTRYERQILTAIMDQGIRAGTPTEKILAAVNAKRSEMASWKAQDALKQLRPELFTGQKATY